MDEQVAAEKRNIEKMLNEIPLGRASLEWVRSHGVTVVYGYTGTYYLKPSNTLYVSAYRPDTYLHVRWFVAAVYEAQHLGTPDPWTTGRQEFISGRMYHGLEESIQQILAHRQLEQARGKSHTSSNPYYLTDYEAAYNKAIQVHQPPLEPTSEEARRVGHEAGREAVKRQKYEDFPMEADVIGMEWDRVHQPWPR